MTDRPLRKDAERNRQRILDAAQELFAQRGLGVTLNDVAHHAGVGVGTVYRRFPDKAQLIDELFEQRLAEIVSLIETAVRDPDPWHGLVTFLESALAVQAGDRAVKELLFVAPGGVERVGRMRAQMLPLGTELVERAQSSGKLRSGIAAQDMPLLQLMIGTIIDVSRDYEPELWRRFLAIVVQGLRADPQPPEQLPAPPPDPDVLQRMLAAWRPARG
ncbi:MAG TPA: TetR/AcrR family transcriptional regulator [Solirubrobacteraceae bacterium]